MARKYRVPTLAGHRVCNRCERELPATAETFVKDASRSLGLAYECRDCHSKRKECVVWTPIPWSELTAEQKAARKRWAQAYRKTPYGRAIGLWNAYKRTDGCDMTSREVMELIGDTPCVYCGTVTAPRGLDRIDNARPHFRDNVQVACGDCNVMRGDRFTVEEMRVIGRAVAEVRAARHSLPPA